MKDPRFPELTQKQINTLKKYGGIENHKEDTRVFTLGDLQYDFFVILNGQVSIEDPSNDNKVIVSHGKNEFSGDSGMLSNRGAQFHAIAKAGTCLLRINPKKLKEAIAEHSDISDVLLNAFLLRQETVLNEYTGGIRLVGSGNSKETYELREFLDEKNIWYNFLDVDVSDEAQALLENFNITAGELTILIPSDAPVCPPPS